MLRSWAIAGVCFALMVLLAGPMMLNALLPDAVLGALLPNAREIGLAAAAMSFAVAAVIERAP